MSDAPDRPQQRQADAAEAVGQALPEPLGPGPANDLVALAVLLVEREDVQVPGHAAGKVGHGRQRSGAKVLHQAGRTVGHSAHE